ncbi:MAG TPA: NADH-quinone oxidoreductase subunit M, partial [Ferruginibacter sp.]|nr:NADH-quinone oxidoreductase subunit M [Ferruginibacter sp.]
VTAGIGIILSAVYTLNMIQKIFYGETNTVTSTVGDISWNEKLTLAVIVLIIFITGVYPQPLIDLTRDALPMIVTK